MLQAKLVLNSIPNVVAQPAEPADFVRDGASRPTSQTLKEMIVTRSRFIWSDRLYIRLCIAAVTITYSNDCQRLTKFWIT